MTQEEKQLLLKDLSARLQYNVQVLADMDKTFDGGGISTLKVINLKKDWVELEGVWTPFKFDEIKPYLRPMSSMTPQEWCELCDCDTEDEKAAIYLKDGRRFVSHANRETFLNSHHFDYRGLIERGLAIEAPEGMYEIQD